MRISALILGTLFAVGCSSAANKKLDEFADRACACKDAKCGQEVMGDFLKWAQENKDARGDEGKAEKSMKKMQDCIAKLTTKGMDKAMDKAMDKPADDKAMDKPADKPADEKPAN
jgi:hypothetical protein